MPLYEYECERCGKRFELIRKFSDPPVETCFTCGGPVHKLLSSPAIQFKGTGWYITDYARKSAPASDGGKAAGGEGTKAETKSETKGDSGSTATASPPTSTDT